jgi:two-component sensor histidine kinase/ABC-type amino acid transport substrate-binding protein
MFLLFIKKNISSFKNFFLVLGLLATFSTYQAKDIVFTEQEQAWIKSHPVIEFGYEPTWLPFEIYKDGEYSGIIGEYVKILERETGITFKPIPNITWEETVAGLKSGKVDFTCCAGITPEREQYLNFTKPYISSPMVIVTRKDGDFVGELADLRGKTISLPEKYYTGEVISKDYPSINIDYKPGIEDAIKAVSLGEAEAFVGNLVVVSYYIEHMGYSNLKIAAPTNYNKAHIGLAARKDWPELISIAQKVFDNISYEERNAILQKWMKVRYEFGVNMKEIWSYVFIFGSIILVVFIIILLWNKSLKKEINKRERIEKELENALKTTNKKSEERKVLLQEIHHRVKNNLQIIISLLRLQKDNMNEVFTGKIDETISRINSIALVHEKVYQTEDIANIKLQEYILLLAEEIIKSFSDKNKPTLTVKSTIEEIDIKSLIPLALILNELITNSLKYGVKDLENGVIRINIDNHDTVLIMEYYDNGTWIENNKPSFGLSLIETFTEQLDGSFSRKIENGTSYSFKFNIL